MYTGIFPSDWRATARNATPEEISAFPHDVCVPDQGSARSLFEQGSIQLLYIPRDHPALAALAVHMQDASCLKHPTSALVISGDYGIGIGTNAGRRWSFCMRARIGAKTGEGYEHCRNTATCNQKEHAEVMALYDAVCRVDSVRGATLQCAITAVNHAIAARDSLQLTSCYAERNRIFAEAAVDRAAAEGGGEGLDMVLLGHWWCCHSCTTAMLAAGVRRIYLVEGARDLYDPMRTTTILPKLDNEGYPRHA